MYPELFRIGNFPINTYGVLLALSFLVALFVAARLGERDGLKRERIYDLGLWMLLAGLVGSKLLLMVVEPEYASNPLHLFSLDFLRSGGVWYGGFLGGLAGGIFLMHRYRLPFWKTADAFAPGLAIGQAVGRQGCFAAGCCWGKPTTLPWGVHFTELGHEVTGVPIIDANGAPLHLHPTQLYESFAMLALFFLLVRLHRRKRFSGQVLLTYAVLYGLMRFVIEFFRADPRGDIAGLTTLTHLSTSQMISLAVFIGGLVFLFLRRRRHQRASSDGDEGGGDGAPVSSAAGA
ncbi:MAG TPA: prolipoprotein diacylglyceryl transferase [Pyrinomonadaceae bacterium]|nr:prolipoprotein diacylglyceryl transferase [Pyrinomonadaceae bacterium]